MLDFKSQMFNDHYVVEVNHNNEVHYVVDGEYAKFKNIGEGQIALLPKTSLEEDVVKHKLSGIPFILLAYPSMREAKASTIKLYEQLKKNDDPDTKTFLKSLETVRIVNKNVLFGGDTIDVDIKNISTNPISYTHVKVTDPVNVDVEGMFETCRDRWGGIYTIQRGSDLHKLLKNYADREHSWLNYDDIDFPEEDENGDGGIYDILDQYEYANPPCQIDLKLTICLE